MGNGALAIGPKLPRPSSTLPTTVATLLIKKTDLKFRCTFEACGEHLTYHQHGGCVTYAAEGRVHSPGSRVRLEKC